MPTSDFFSRLRRHLSNGRQRAVLLSVLTGVFGLCCYPQADVGSRQEENCTPIGYVQSICHESAAKSTAKKTVALFVDFAKFGCVTCLSQFLDFCDSLKGHSSRAIYPNVVLLIERDQQDEIVQYRQMQSWTSAIGIDFPFYLAPPCVFTDNMVGNVSLIILNNDGTFDDYADFPLSPQRIRSILGHLFPQHPGARSD